jgi:CMP/dCMP kinase
VRNRIIAIDGPSASGKSTVARRLASRLGCTYVDSGAVYRGITWKVLEDQCDPARTEEVGACLGRMSMEFFVTEGAVRFRIDGVEPGPALRSEAISGRVSEVAAMPAVRAAATGWLRTMICFGDLVMEGRDIGTVVFPDADFKFYLDASPAERARRRSAELRADTEGVPAVLAALQRRDGIDSGRTTAPLRIAEGAVVLDTTGLSIDEVVGRIVGAIEARGTACQTT